MNGAFMGILGVLAGVGVVVLFIVAVIQQSKHEGSGFKQAFYTVTSLVMLALAIGSLAIVLTTTLKRTVFNQAVSVSDRYNLPPTLYLPGHPGEPVKEGNTYSCDEQCDFTADDKAQFASWKSNYQSWKQNLNSADSRFRNDLVGPLSFLIVSLPLFLVFMRLMERGAAAERKGTNKPTSLRSLYFYFIAFSGLIMAVVSTGAMLNTGLRVALKAEDQNFSEPIPAIDQGNGIRSIIACQDKCGFTDEDVQLANQWLNDSADFKNTNGQNTGRIHEDLANNIPMLLLGLPLFWWHFSRIRKESQTPAAPATPTPATS